MEKLTDNEIIKALECCCDEEVVHFCSKCPMYIQDKENDFCQEDLAKKALDLINRQNAEMKSLTEKLEVLGDPLQDAQYKIAEQRAEIERLKKSLDNMTDALVKTDEACRKAETEVIKEFAKTFVKNAKTISTGRCREIPTFNKIPYDIKLIYQISKDEFDNLVKEMVGDAE